MPGAGDCRIFQVNARLNFCATIEAFSKVAYTKSVDSEPDWNESYSYLLGRERSRQEIEQQRRDELNEALQCFNFFDVILKQKPFVASDVFAEIEKFWSMGLDNCMVRSSPSLYREPLERSKRAITKDELQAQLNKICEKIRRRLRVEFPQEAT